MKFCKHCGASIKEDAKFCNHCGASLGSPENNETEIHKQSEIENTPKGTTEPDVKKEEQQEFTHTQSTEQNNVQPGVSSNGGGTKTPQGNVPVKKMSPKTKMIIGIAAIIVIAFIVLFKIGESMYAPDKTAEKFKEAVINQDASAMKKLIISEEDSLKIEQNHIESMLEYLDDEENTRDSIIEHIDEQANGFAKGKDDSFASLFEEEQVFNLKKDGKFLMFDKYKVEISPVYFELTTNYKDTELFVNDESVGKSKKEYDSKKVGPYLPGTYEFKAKHKSKFAELETDKTADNFGGESVPVVDLSIEGQSVTFDVPFYDLSDDDVSKVNLIINNKETGIDLLEDSTVQPMKTGKDVKASFEAEFPWGKMRSTEFVVDSTYPRSDFQVDEKLQKELKEQIIKSEKEQFEALTTGGKKLPTKMDKKLVEELKKRAEADVKDEKTYKFEYLGSDFDTSTYTLSKQGDDWQIDVKTTSHRKEAIGNKSDKAKVDFKEQEKSKRYTFVYNKKEKAWIIKSYEGFGSPNQSTIDKYREKEPKTFETK